MRRTGEARELLPVEHVFDSDADLAQVVEYVELGQVERVVAVDAARVAQHDEVEPATAPAPARRHAELAPDLLQVHANILRGVRVSVHARTTAGSGSGVR
jgi:hypothetical protein